MKRELNRAERGLVEQVIRHAKSKPEESVEDRACFVPTGSALLNLALSDKAMGGYLTGKIVNLIGDSSSGKTFHALSMLAACAYDERFDGYRLIYDDAEAANEFDFVKLFGQKAAERITPPSLDRDDPGHSHTTIDFQANIRRLLADDIPFIYVQDSFDSLTTEAEIKHAEEVEKAHETGKEAKGSYGMDKARHASVLLRLVAADLKKTKSLLLIISQTRDNIDPMSFQRKTRSGGKALYFYCSYEMWMAVSKKLSVKINNRDRRVGIVTRIKITKNKHNGKVREIDVPIYYHYGVDDISACIDFLLSEGHWKMSGGRVSAPEFSGPTHRTKLIERVESSKENQFKLYKIVQKVWCGIEAQIQEVRKPKFQREE